MPTRKWNGYERFCPLARALDLVGERWTLVVVHELQRGPLRFTELYDSLPGISPNVLSDRLRKLETDGLVARRAGAVGKGVGYELADAGRDLADALEALRVWGVRYLVTPRRGDGPMCRFDVSFVQGVDDLPDEEYEWSVDGQTTTLHQYRGVLDQRAGAADDPAVRIETTAAFMRRWARGEVTWDDGRIAGDVIARGGDDAWRRMLAATGYERAAPRSPGPTA